MHGAATVSQCFLSKPLGISARFRPLCPRVPIGVQADAVNARNPTTPTKLCRAVVGRSSLDCRKQIAEVRKRLQEFPQFSPDRQASRFAERSEFFAAVNQDTSLPIDVVCSEVCSVRLRGSGFVEQLVKRPTFTVLFGSDDCYVFLGRDRSLALTSDFRPRSFCEDGPREPTEIESQVVQSPQVVSNAVPVCVDDSEQVCARCLDERFATNWIVRFAAKSPRAPLLRCRNSVRRHFVHHCLPGALCHFWIVGGEVSTSDREIDGRLPVGFVHRIEQAFGFAPVSCAKRPLLR